jgi:hypothetical protein
LELKVTTSALRVSITIDLDPDHQTRPGHMQGIAWQGLVAGVPALRGCFQELADLWATPIEVTWFARHDDQVDLTRDKAHRQARQRIEDLARGGQHVAWHPHLYRQRSHRWVLEKEAERLEVQVRRHLDLVKMLPIDWQHVRIGEAFHSTHLMNLLDQLGVVSDATALPGRHRHDEHYHIDWRPTPATPYHPDRRDYRVAGDGETSLSIVEVPFSMLPLQAPYDSAPLRRYFNLAFRPELMREAIHEHVRQNDQIIAVVHPHEALPTDSDHPLVAHDIDAVRANLMALYQAANQASKKLEFLPISRLASTFQRSGQ